MPPGIPLVRRRNRTGAGYIRADGSRAAGPDAVFGGPCGPLLNAFHHALLHSLRCSAQVFVVVGQTVRIPHPHAGQLHQAAHLRAAQLVLQIKIRLAAAHGRFLCRPAGMQAVHSSLCAAGKAGQRRQFRALHRQFLPGLFRLQLYGFLCRGLRHSGRFFCFVRLHGAGGHRLPGLRFAQGRGSGFSLCKEL